MKIQSYLRKPNKEITDLEAVKRDPDAFFIEIGDQDALSAIARKLDWNYVEGAIRMQYGEQVLLDFVHWDLVDQLWAYLLNMIEEVLENGAAESHFPDQPTRLEMGQTAPNSILFTVTVNGNPQKTLLPRVEFFKALLAGANEFFQTLRQYATDTSSYDDQLERIEQLERQVI